MRRGAREKEAAVFNSAVSSKEANGLEKALGKDCFEPNSTHAFIIFILQKCTRVAYLMQNYFL